jgi:hypothetical protein
MSVNGAFQNPLASHDFSMLFGGLKIPPIDVVAAVEIGQKNFAAMTAMNTEAFSLVTAIARRQGG